MLSDAPVFRTADMRAVSMSSNTLLKYDTRPPCSTARVDENSWGLPKCFNPLCFKSYSHFLPSFSDLRALPHPKPQARRLSLRSRPPRRCRKSLTHLGLWDK
jgi:hypothetical protein